MPPHVCCYWGHLEFRGPPPPGSLRPRQVSALMPFRGAQWCRSVEDRPHVLCSVAFSLDHLDDNRILDTDFFFFGSVHARNGGGMEGEGERESEANSAPGAGAQVGLDLTALRSRPEPKSGVGSLTTCTTMVPLIITTLIITHMLCSQLSMY